LDGGVDVGMEVGIVRGAGWNKEVSFWVKEGDVLVVLGDVPRGVVSGVKEAKAELSFVYVNKSEAC
jgi:hypothetical protein